MRRKKTRATRTAHKIDTMRIDTGYSKKSLAGQTVKAITDDGTEKLITINPPPEITAAEYATTFYRWSSCFW